MAKGQSNRYSLGSSKEDKYDFLLSVIGTSSAQQKNKKNPQKVFRKFTGTVGRNVKIMEV